jgi:hypothetical protein
MITQFALRLICGMSATWCLMPRSEVTCGFFRIQMLVTLGLGVLAALFGASLPAVEQKSSLLSLTTIQGLAVGAAVASYIGSVVWTLARRRAGGAFAGIVFVTSVVALIGSLPRSAFEHRGPAVLAFGSELSAAWLLGGSITAMLLGHWYLTAPMMKIRPLQVLNFSWAASALSRGVFAGAALFLLEPRSFSTMQSIWLAMRWICGIVAPLILAILVRQILRYRNTQSATGVLFAGDILVFIGETTAALLARDLSWPL